ncbi:hypothetical protein GPX89_25705 [Nocardia sp. ET3-3]|uniref:Uncharacterized protein n=1 Tax=Nocardia terrae TaxID=2675851 RepID=A0A7K1V1W9_9NOCA|nr:hypothetical protein [Nocardia terrae]MVU80633.1 hypothetical protein [Nocardia terrae]
MPAHNTPGRRTPAASVHDEFPVDPCACNLDVCAALVVLLSRRLRTVESENRRLAWQVHELTQDRDDLLDAVNVHVFCAHEERLIGQASFYDRSPHAIHG